ncbi:cellulose binding domain-containing protein [Micromonospora sp. C51]|uniref:cellulose binding domain-containing protein n=1 Tax=Micromonospora sp. C51 TaxID=2824879 RepID=UPI001B395A13|nr:cellulose binding domain-containing protein [Micromonospora sp. C51]MBQ1047394.1 cellulose binding domain-containing protein [Micromonospora sp. C51]
MLRTLGVVLTAVTLAAVAGVTAAGAADTPTAPTPVPLWTPSPSPTPSLTPTPTPTVACPPALPISGMVTGVTATSVTISYSLMFSGPPCGYDLPMTVLLFTSRDDAAKWQNPVAEAITGLERNGQVTLDGLTPDTEYWFRFSDVEARRDPYVIGGPARTEPLSPCGATATIDARWGSGFVATVTVRNTGSESLDGWLVRWRWSGDEQIQSVWGGVPDNSAADVTVRNAPYNGTVAPGGTTTFGLLASASTVPEGITLTCGS